MILVSQLICLIRVIVHLNRKYAELDFRSRQAPRSAPPPPPPSSLFCIFKKNTNEISRLHDFNKDLLTPLNVPSVSSVSSLQIISQDSEEIVFSSAENCFPSFSENER